MIFRASLLLFSIATLTSTQSDGTVFQVSDETDEVDNKFRLYYEVTQAGTQTSSQGNPYTTTLHVEHSPDGSTWMPLVTAETLASDTTVRKFIDLPALMSFVRVRTEVPGTNKPTHKAVVRLMSNRTFRYLMGSNKKLLRAS